MKKYMFVAALVVGGLSASWAGHFTDLLPPAAPAGCTPVSNGYDYTCSNDTVGPTAIGLTSKTLSQLNALQPSTTYQILVCSNCQNSQVCLSTGVTTGAWVALSSGTTTGQQHCN